MDRLKNQSNGLTKKSAPRRTNKHTTNPSRLVINVPLGLGKVVLHLTLDFYTIIAWNMLRTKVFPVMAIKPQHLKVRT